MSIKKLKILVDTTFEEFPDESVKLFIVDAVDEYDQLRSLFQKLVHSKIIDGKTLLADPDVYNEMVEIFNRTATEEGKPDA